MKEDPYRSIAGWYDRLFEPLNRKVRSIGLGLSALTEGMEVLDVGCGTGSLLGSYQQRGCAVSGIDSSPAMLEVAQTKLGGKARLTHGDASQMPYRDDSFDLVTAMLALHEMSQLTRLSVLSEMRRVLKGDGQILLIDFHPGPLRPIPGWWVKLVTVLSEVAAGREHFQNFRDFMKRGGVPPLIQTHDLGVRRQRIVGGGALGVFLLKAPGGAPLITKSDS